MRSSPELVRLLGDYFEAKADLEKGATAVPFRDQLATEASIDRLLFEETDRLSIPREQIFSTIILSQNGTLT